MNLSETLWQDGEIISTIRNDWLLSFFPAALLITLRDFSTEWWSNARPTRADRVRRGNGVSPDLYLVYVLERRRPAVERRVQLGGRARAGVHHNGQTVVQLRETCQTDNVGHTRNARSAGGQQSWHGPPQTSQHGRRYCICCIRWLFRRVRVPSYIRTTSAK